MKLILGDCLEEMKKMPDKINIPFYLTSYSLLVIISKIGDYYGKR